MVEVRSGDQKIEAVARVLFEWNPFGDAAKEINDLDGYRTEATDIFSVWPERASHKTAAKIVMEMLNDAFDLSLELEECLEAAKKIRVILNES